MEGTLYQVLMIVQFDFGMHRQVTRWETPSKRTHTQSGQLHSHQMGSTLSQAQMMGQFNFGMHRQVARWESHFEGTPTQSGQLHSHQMEGTLCQVLLIAQFDFGMHGQVAHLKIFSAIKCSNANPHFTLHPHQFAFHLPLNMHSIIIKVFCLTCPA